MPPSPRRIAITLAALLLTALALALAATRLVAPLALAVSDPTRSADALATEQPPDAPAIPRELPVQRDAVTPPSDADAPPQTDPADRRSRARARSRQRRASEPPSAAATQSRVIRRDAIERALTNPSTLGPASVELQRGDGRPTGLRLSGIRPGTPLAAIGLRNGDVLLSVNGLTVHHPDRALEALATLPDVSDLRVRILRAGSPRTLRFSVR